jgi:hypothetical protein
VEGDDVLLPLSAVDALPLENRAAAYLALHRDLLGRLEASAADRGA